MASPHSETTELLVSLQECARRGDWVNAEVLASTIRRVAPPDGHAGRAEYLQHLNDALITAKASRAQTAASLVRLNAACRFHESVNDPAPPRHNFGDPPNF
jgi:hypothetical protein